MQRRLEQAAAREEAEKKARLEMEMEMDAEEDELEMELDFEEEDTDDEICHMEEQEAKRQREEKIKNDEAKLEADKITAAEVQPAPEIQCEHCDLSFVESELVTHLKKHPLVVCQLCQRQFTNARIFEDVHIKGHAGDQPPFSCPIKEDDLCKTQVFDDFGQWKEHVYNHQKPTTKVVPCQQKGVSLRKKKKKQVDVEDQVEQEIICQHCNLRFNTEWKLVVHLKNHPLIHCQLCELRFTNSLLFDLHLKVHAGDRPPFTCPIDDRDLCRDRGFDSFHFWKEHLYYHKRPVRTMIKVQQKGVRMTLKNPELPPTCCKICEKSFKNEAGLTIHMSIVHPTKKRITCGVPMCSMTFGNDRAKFNHWKRAHSSILLHCDLTLTCDRFFINEKDLEAHQESTVGSHSLDSVSCPKCNRIMQRRGLGTHLRKHHHNETRIPCNKPDCLKKQLTFKTPAALQKHERSAHEIDPLTCFFCPMVFIYQARHLLHLRTKHESELIEQPDVCPEISRLPCHVSSCSMIFISSKKLLIHLQRSHNYTLTNLDDMQRIKSEEPDLGNFGDKVKKKAEKLTSFSVKEEIE